MCYTNKECLVNQMKLISKNYQTGKQNGYERFAVL